MTYYFLLMNCFLSVFKYKSQTNDELYFSVTIDPHKAGFCPYPAGALLYRNGTMKGFITLAAPEVFHSPDDLNVGVYGLEGSKPGAAACGVLLSHRVSIIDMCSVQILKLKLEFF